MCTAPTFACANATPALPRPARIKRATNGGVIDDDEYVPLANGACVTKPTRPPPMPHV